MLKFIGLGLISLPFIAIFIVGWKLLNLKSIILIFMSVGVVVAIITLGVYLIRL